jgi:transposase
MQVRRLRRLSEQRTREESRARGRLDPSLSVGLLFRHLFCRHVAGVGAFRALPGRKRASAVPQSVELPGIDRDRHVPGPP